MKVKIQKLIPYTQQNKKLKTQHVTLANKTYFISPNPLDQRNYSGAIIQLLFTCQFPDNPLDYQYLKYQLRVENIEHKQIVKKQSDHFKDIKKNEGKRQFMIEFVLPYQGAYNLLLDLSYKAKAFVQSSVAPEEKRENLKIAISCELPFELVENIIYQEKPSSISFPLFVQYIITSKIKQSQLQLSYRFTTEFFLFNFINTQPTILLRPLQTYYLLLQIKQKPQKQKRNILFGDKGHLIGTLWLENGKNQLEKKLFLTQGYKHLLFKGQSVDKKVVKKDIVEVRIKFINTYEMDYNIGNIRISIEEKQLPAGIKLLKISKDKIDLTKNNEEIITLTLICMRSGLFQLKGIVLNIKDKVNTLEERILKYVNELTLVVQNEKQKKGEIVMQKTSEVEIDSLI